MNKYSLKQFLLENKEQADNNFERSTSISRLIGGMQNNKTITENTDQPIVPKGTGWDHLTEPNRLRRIFTIENQYSRRIFVNDILNLADQTMHGIIVRIRGEVTEVEIYTEELNDVTNMDFEYAKDIDEMYVDAISSYNNSDEGDTDDLW